MSGGGNGMLGAIVAVMVGAGALGGLVGRFLGETAGRDRPAEAPADSPAAAPLAWWKHVLIGIASALMVPLFLNMISSDLIARIRGVAEDSGDPLLLLNLAGFCLVAAVSSRGFIGSLSERLLQEVRQARAQADQAAGAAAEARQQAGDAAATAGSALEQARSGLDLAQAQWIEEPDPAPAGAATRSRGLPGEAGAPADADRELLRQLARPPATLRLPAALAAASGLDEAQARAALARLQARGWAGCTPGRDGQPRWFATASGRGALGELGGD
ncbi:YEATS-associated helix-containing protein [Sphaerotilus uruguayifluvii]|nr:YEATS-associated helix-containing protein [Leptothrix sp. C29]